MEYVPSRNTNLSDSDNPESAENVKREGSQGSKWEVIIKIKEKAKESSEWEDKTEECFALMESPSNTSHYRKA